jgi:hypothetical protein
MGCQGNIPVQILAQKRELYLSPQRQSGESPYLHSTDVQNTSEQYLWVLNIMSTARLRVDIIELNRENTG